MDESVKKKLAELKKAPRKPKEPEVERKITFSSGTKKSELSLNTKQRIKLEKFIDKLGDPPKPRIKKEQVPNPSPTQ